MRAEPACLIVYRFCAGDDAAGALWHSCAPVAECEVAAAFLDYSCELVARLLDSESCGKAGWQPPFCGQVELS